jgi:DNA (cytosine-5)-methyltransferase 1
MVDQGEGHSSPPEKLKIIDLFAGCGGLSQGFRQSGRYEPVAAVEKDLYAAATYAANFGEDHVYQGDIADWLEGPLPRADVVVGGPPCQGFSNLGAKREDDERNELWERYVETLTRVKPKVFVLENVDRFLKTHQFDEFRSELEDGHRLEDYEIDANVLKATEYGSFQLRRRAIVIGTRKGIPKVKAPAPIYPEEEGWLTVKHAIGDIDETIPEDKIDLPRGRTVEAFGKVIPGQYTAEDLHITRNYTDLSRKRFSTIPYGGNRFDLPEHLKAPCWKKHSSGSGDVMGRLRWEKHSVTIRTEFFKPEKGRYLHPSQDRALSHHEAARLQGFPDEFLWCGTKLEIARQIGNAVPVQLAEALACHIYDHLESVGHLADLALGRRLPRISSMTVARPTRASNEGVRRSMQSNKSRDTKPELALRRTLHALGLRYRVATQPLPAFRRTADLVFTRVKLAVFVDGCFWHGCPDHHTQAKANSEYWSEKFRRNKERDAETTEFLQQQGWTVLRFWEHQDPAEAAEQVSLTYWKLRGNMRSLRTDLEVPTE